MSENNLTLKLNFSGPSYDDSFANYCNHDNIIGKFTSGKEGGRAGGKEEEREGWRENAIQRADHLVQLKVKL